jgi:tight adherence protein B
MPGMDADLTAIALSGGVSVSRARTLVDAARGEDADDSVAVRDTLLLSEAAGVPAVELLRSAAALDRHRARVDGRLRAARLSTKLLLPLGICTLPAFLCLGVAPMFLSILPSVSLPLP